jgi:hypothetical protein
VYGTWVIADEMPACAPLTVSVPPTTCDPGRCALGAVTVHVVDTSPPDGTAANESDVAFVAVQPLGRFSVTVTSLSAAGDGLVSVVVTVPEPPAAIADGASIDRLSDLIDIAKMCIDGMPTCGDGLPCGRVTDSTVLLGSSVTGK